MNSEVKYKLNWTNTLFLVGLPILTAVSLIYYIQHYGVHISDVAIFALMYWASGLAITTGYHRYYSHRAFECHGLVQYYFLLFGAAAFENSALAWCSDHRIHHRYVDQEKDPYNIKKGFFWAHMGWVFFDTPTTNTPPPDLNNDKKLQWQNKHYVLIGVLISLLVPVIWGLFFGRPGGALIWGSLLRIVMVHHGTFFINSAAHVFGKRPYSTQNSARDSSILAFFSFGEGYHNYHHTFPSDYRNGIKWYQWDPTKWLILALKNLKLARALKKIDDKTIEMTKLRQLQQG